MKVIGETERGVILEATFAELVSLSGGKVSECDRYGNRNRVIGVTFDVVPVWRHMNALNTAAENAKQGASFLRGLADMLDKGIPDWIAEPPKPAEPAKDGGAAS